MDSEHSLGNGKLTNPVGLITIDETAYAGGVYNVPNSLYYLYTNKTYWTMSPSDFDANNANAYVWYIFLAGRLNTYYSTPARGVRPVINLSTNVIVTDGDGSSEDNVA